MYADVIPAVWHHRRDEMAVSVCQGGSDSLSAERQSRLQHFASIQVCGTSSVVSPTQTYPVHFLGLLCQGQVCMVQPEIHYIVEYRDNITLIKYNPLSTMHSQT